MLDEDLVIMKNIFFHLMRMEILYHYVASRLNKVRNKLKQLRKDDRINSVREDNSWNNLKELHITFEYCT